MSSTIKDVAKLADVSIATVSNVLNESKNVSELLKARVYDAIEQLDYRPNSIARSLKTNRSYSLGVIVPDVLNPFFAEVLKSIQHEASRKDYQILMYDSEEDAKREKQLMNSLIHAGVDGIIDITSRMKEDELREGILVPLVMADRQAFSSSDNVAFACVDNYTSGKLAAAHLVEQQYEKYVCIAGPVDTTTVAAKRMEGFTDRLCELGISTDDIIIKKCKYNFDEGYSVMKSIIREMETSKSYGVYASSDVMAWGSIEACNSMNIRIPDQIGIIGNDNIWCSEYVAGGFSTIENSAQKLGEISAKMLIEAIDHNGIFLEKEITLAPEICVRKTT